jgi:NADH dehydrogenase FAD-containing subunit
MKMKEIGNALALLLFATTSMVDGFVLGTRKPFTTALFKNSAIGQDSEKMLRKELDQRNYKKVDNEEKYAVTEALGLEGALPVNGDSTTLVNASVASTTVDRDSLEATMERLIQPRAYPLFLAEKAAEIVEDAAAGFFKAFLSPLTESSSSSFAQVNGRSGKEKVVILGSGWGAVPFLKDIDTNRYDVICISPRNYFLFTPMLAGASVGTVEFRSICEPIREVCNFRIIHFLFELRFAPFLTLLTQIFFSRTTALQINRKTDFLEATATEIDPTKRTVTCQSVKCEGTFCGIEEFTVEFDRLIMTIGAQTNTYGIPGVREHCCFLKQVEDARRIRTSIVNCFERAYLPSLTDEERKNDLTFVVIGAGPTGIEFASELRDFIEQDGPKYYPSLLKFVRIKVVEATSTILAPFEKSLQEEAATQLQRDFTIHDQKVRDLLPEKVKLTELLLESSVKEVREDVVELNGGREIKYGLAVWAAGNGPLPLTLQLVEALGEEQKAEQKIARGRIAVDPWLRAIGGNGRIFAYGDCSCIMPRQLPATAQVALQQGEYLSKLLNRGYNPSPPITEEGIFPPPTRDPKHGVAVDEAIADAATKTSDYAKPFQFLNMGMYVIESPERRNLAFIGLRCESFVTFY